MPVTPLVSKPSAPIMFDIRIDQRCKATRKLEHSHGPDDEDGEKPRPREGNYLLEPA